MKQITSAPVSRDQLSSQTHEWLMKVHKHATASLNVKQVTEILALFPGWTVVKMPMLKQSDASRSFSDAVSVRLRGRTQSMLVTTMGQTLRQQAVGYEADVMEAVYAKMTTFAAVALPAVETVKADQWVVLNLSPIDAGNRRHNMVSYECSFDLYRRVNVTRVTAPNGQSFDICGPVQTLGYGGTKTCADFFTWARTHTDLEASVNALLGLTRHVSAAERGRVPKFGQSLGHCPVCDAEQVVRGTKMVFHGYQRPGDGVTHGRCYGVGEDAYEISANGCKKYLHSLTGWKVREQARLAELKGDQTALTLYHTRRVARGRPGQMETIEVTLASDPKLFAAVLAKTIANSERAIVDYDHAIAHFNKKIADWKPGTLRRNEERAR
jgi:hypothetical protein